MALTATTRALYRLHFEPNIENQWLLGDPIVDGVEHALNLWCKMQRPIADLPGGMMTPVVLPVRNGGTVLDFNFGDGYVPIVRNEVGGMIDRVAPGAAQRIPAIIEGRSCNEQWNILNVLDSVACLDEDRSVFTRSKKRPGRYSAVDVLRCREEATRGHDLFMVEGWVALIGSDRLKAAFDGAGVTGLVFQPV